MKQDELISKLEHFILQQQEIIARQNELLIESEKRIDRTNEMVSLFAQSAIRLQNTTDHLTNVYDEHLKCLELNRNNLMDKLDKTFAEMASIHKEMDFLQKHSKELLKIATQNTSRNESTSTINLHKI